MPAIKTMPKELIQISVRPFVEHVMEEAVYACIGELILSVETIAS